MSKTGCIGLGGFGWNHAAPVLAIESLSSFSPDDACAG